MKVFYLPTVAETLGKLVADVGWLPLLEDSLLDPLLEDALLDPAAATPGPLLADSSNSCPGCPSWRCPAKAITPLPFQNNYLTPRNTLHCNGLHKGATITKSSLRHHLSASSPP